jgi:hypothetical protein
MKKRALPPGLPPAGEVPVDPYMPAPKPSADIPYICLRGAREATTIRACIRRTKGGFSLCLKHRDYIVFETLRGWDQATAEDKLKNLIGQTWTVIPDTIYEKNTPAPRRPARPRSRM